VSPSCFDIFAQTHARLLEFFSFKASILFSKSDFSLLVVLEKRYVGKVVDKMTGGSCILTDSVKSGNDCSSLIHNIETLFIILRPGHMLIWIRPIWHTWLVKSYEIPGWFLFKKRSGDHYMYVLEKL